MVNLLYSISMSITRGLQMISYISFFYVPYLYSLLLSTLCGPVGSLIVWRRMSFFGETIAHASLLGFVLRHMLGWSLEFSMGLVSLAYCAFLELIDRHDLEQSSFLPMLSYGVMGGSLVLIEKIIHNPSLVYTVLIGDILLVRRQDCWALAVLIGITSVLLFFYYRPLILTLFSKELGQLHTRSARWMSFLINSLIALSVSMAVQAVGILLAMGLFTIPALTAAVLSSGPRQMMIYTSLIAAGCSTLGFVVSLSCDLALGPTITLIALLAHFVVRLVRSFC